MKTQLVAVLAGGLLYAPLASAAEDAAAIAAGSAYSKLR